MYLQLVGAVSAWARMTPQGGSVSRNDAVPGPPQSEVISDESSCSRSTGCSLDMTAGSYGEAVERVTSIMAQESIWARSIKWSSKGFSSR